MQNETTFQNGNQKATSNGPYTASQMFGLNVYDNTHPKQQLPKVDLTQAKCSMGKQCMYVCRSENCETKGVVCADKKCECRNSHKKLCTWADPFDIVELIEQKRVCNVDLIKDIEVKFDVLIDEISLLRCSVIEQLKGVGLNEFEKALLKNLNNKEFDTFNGKIMSKIIENIDEKQEHLIKQKQKVFLEIVDENWKIIQTRIMQECSKIFQVISSFKIQETLKLKQKKKEIATLPKIESKVVTSAQQFKIMINFFKQDKIPKSFNLLYRASENEFKVSHFKQKCTNIPNTMTLIKTTFDKIIGGYTPLCWKEKGGWSADHNKQSFVFSVTENVKFELKDDKKYEAIYNCFEQGPNFGLPDLKLGDLSNQPKNSIAKIGSHYTHPSFKFQDKQAWKKFTGNQQDFFFVTKQWEVFQVQF